MVKYNIFYKEFVGLFLLLDVEVFNILKYSYNGICLIYSKDLHASSQYGHEMQSRGPTRSDEQAV